MIKDIVEKIHESAYCSECNQHKILCLMSRRQAPLSEATLQQLKALLSDSEFCSRVHDLFLREAGFRVEVLRGEIDEAMKIGRNPKFAEIELEMELEKLEISDFNGVLCLYGENLKASYEGVSNCARGHYGDGVEAFVAEYYVVYKVVLLFYEEYRRSRYVLDDIELDLSASLIDLYSGVDVRLQDVDRQFAKYGLLSFNENMRFDCDHLARGVVDKRLNKFFSIPVSQILAESIYQLYSDGKVGTLAFRIKCIADGRPSMEEKAYGSILDLEVSELPAVSEFYSVERFGDKLTVIHDQKSQSLIFEELNDDFQLAGDSVVTQLVHLEYERTEGGYLITHIDHEQILYSLDQYEQRVSEADVSVRGHKVKSFKIDGASIPFDYRFKDELFLVIVLDDFFVNKKLIAEYFEGFNAGERKV